MSHLASIIFPSTKSRTDRISSVQHIVTIQNAYNTENNQIDVSNPNTSRAQYFAAITINIIAFAHGISVGWISPFLSLLTSNNSPVGAIGDNEISYLGGLLCLGGLFGTFLYGFMAEKIGRKIASIFLAFPEIGWCLSVIFGTQVEHLYLGRFLAGLTAGGVFVLVPLYVAEISEDELRGKLGSYFILAINFGTLIAFVIGNYLDYYLVGKIMLAFPIIFLVIFLILPETPQYLVVNGKTRAAEKSLYFLRGCNETSTIPNCVKDEFQRMKKCVNLNTNSNTNENNSSFWQLMNDPNSMKALLIGVVLVLVNQMTGIFALINYTSSIFEQAGSNLSPNISAIIIGAIQFLGSLVSTFAIDKVPRKILYVLTCIGCVIGLLGMGVHGLLSDLNTGIDMAMFTWVPIVSLSIVIFIASVGVLPLTFIILSEILPQNVRAFGTSFCTSILWIMAYLMLRYFATLVAIINLYGCMFVFAGSVFIGMIFVIIFVPETSGKTFEEINKIL